MASVSDELSSPPVLIAHRGFSSRHPEMTRAAYQAAIEWAYMTEIPLGLECDVHFSADDELKYEGLSYSIGVGAGGGVAILAGFEIVTSD